MKWQSKALLGPNERSCRLLELLLARTKASIFATRSQCMALEQTVVLPAHPTLRVYRIDQSGDCLLLPGSWKCF